MDRDWIAGMYLRIKQARDERLTHILALLRPKAETDTEIKEAVRLLESWVGDNSDQSFQAMQQGDDFWNKRGGSQP